MKLGDVAQQPLLNFFRDQERRAQQVQDLRAWIARLDLAQPTLLVTHQVVISAVAEVPAGDGEIVVMRREADGRLTLQGRQPTA